MAISKKGDCGAYAFTAGGALSSRQEDTRFMGWHIGSTGSAEVKLDGKLDCYINGQLVQGNGTIIYKIQPDDTYIGNERLRPMKCSMESHGLLMPAPSLLTNGSLGLTVTPNAGCKGSMKVSVSGDDDDWSGNVVVTGKPKRPQIKNTPDSLLAKKYEKGCKKEQSVSLDKVSGSVKVFKFANTQEAACSKWDGYYPGTGDLNDLSFRLLGLEVDNCAPTGTNIIANVALAAIPFNTSISSLSTPGGTMQMDPVPNGVVKVLPGTTVAKGIAFTDSVVSYTDGYSGTTTWRRTQYGNIYFQPAGLTQGMSEYTLALLIEPQGISDTGPTTANGNLSRRFSFNAPQQDAYGVWRYVPAYYSIQIGYGGSNQWVMTAQNGAVAPVDSAIALASYQDSLQISIQQTATQYTVSCNGQVKVQYNISGAPICPFDLSICQPDWEQSWDYNPGTVVGSDVIVNLALLNVVGV